MSTGAISQGRDKHTIYILNVRESVPHKDTSYTLKKKSLYVTFKKVVKTVDSTTETCKRYIWYTSAEVC